MNKTNSALKSAIPSLVVLAAGLVAVLAGIAPKFQSSASDMINFSQLYVSVAITVFIAFGGGDIRVPRDWAVDVKAFAIFGGTDDKSAHPPLDGDVPPKRLVIDGFVVFGGLDIKN